MYMCTCIVEAIRLVLLYLFISVRCFSFSVLPVGCWLHYLCAALFDIICGVYITN